MRLLKELTVAWMAYFKALPFISQQRLWRYLFFAGLINLLLFVGLGVFLWRAAGMMSEWLIDIIGIDTLTGSVGDILEWVTRILISVLTFFLYLKLYRYTILIFSAPALALLAEKTQEILTGISHPFSAGQLFSDVMRGLGITLVNLLIELALTLPLYGLSFIPLLTPFTTVLIIAIESYFVGFSMIDYRNEFRRIPAKESRRLIRHHKGLAIGNGLVFNLLLAIPVVGVLIAPPLGVVAAGLAAEQLMDKAAGNLS